MENISLILLKRLFFRVVCCFYQETLKAGQRKKVFGGGEHVHRLQGKSHNEERNSEDSRAIVIDITELCG